MRAENRDIGSGILLNALVIPGAGHLSVGQKAKGYALTIAVLLLICFPILRFNIAMADVIGKLPPQGGNLARFLKAMGIAWRAEGTLILCCLIAILAIWAYGIIDLILLKRRIEGSGEKK